MASEAQTSAGPPLFPIEQALARTSQAAHATLLRADPLTEFFYYRLFFLPGGGPRRPAARVVLNLYGAYQINENEMIRKALETFTSLKLNKAVFQFALSHRIGPQACDCANATKKNPSSNHTQMDELEQRR
ncbi:hypothetical protein [Paraburkholderia rhizosphaerae]|uniref:hypothetical protein n=1 Tax=Paraburkholderia rhizosphaerae TaxID=480658 RepID=UPI001066B507|nr:hypothetical protein [Paraburkholderia rhizosphaerae]